MFLSLSLFLSLKPRNKNFLKEKIKILKLFISFYKSKYVYNFHLLISPEFYTYDVPKELSSV